MAAASRSSNAPERDPVTEVFRPDVDATLIERNLKLSVEERFLQLMELQRFAAELQAAGSKATQG